MCFGGGNSWIIILVIILLFGSCGTGWNWNGNGCGCNNCGCGNSRSNDCGCNDCGCKKRKKNKRGYKNNTGAPPPEWGGAGPACIHAAEVKARGAEKRAPPATGDALLIKQIYLSRFSLRMLS